MYNQIVLIW